MNSGRTMLALVALLATCGVVSAQTQAPELPPAAAGHATPGTAQRPTTSGAGVTAPTPSPNRNLQSGDVPARAPLPGGPAVEPNPANR
jgi:hypothetical protein